MRGEIIFHTLRYIAGLCQVILIVWLFTPGPALGEQPQITLSQVVQAQLAENRGLSGTILLEKGEESLLARAWLTDHAEQTIDVQYFIWSTDNIGILAADFLLRAAERGVRVRVIVDDLMIDAPDHSMLALGAHPNIEIKIYNPKHSVGVSRLKRLYHMVTDFRSFNQRMHDKALIVDNTVAITGGRNMADEYFDYNRQYNFRDRDIFLAGPVVTGMKKNFETFWQSPIAVSLEEILARQNNGLNRQQIRKVYGDLHRYASDPVNFTDEVRQALADLPEKIPGLIEALVWDKVRFIHDLPGKNPGKEGLAGGGMATRELIEVLGQARERIVIQSPYLIMPKGAIDFFAGLVKRGVDIHIVTNSLAATDNLQAFSGYSKQRKKVLQAGIKVYEFKPRPQIRKKLIDRLETLEKSVPIFAIHAKSMVVDGKTLFVGTF
ncbi:MAG: phospholipase D family protein, partial [Thermodesulfobacteriota bacterium]